MKPVYLDNNATTKVDPDVLAAMLRSSPSSSATRPRCTPFGSSVGGAVKRARQQVHALLGAEFDHEIVFTSGGTESDNSAILSALEAMPDPQRDHHLGGRASGDPDPCCASRKDARHQGPHHPGDTKGRLDRDA